MADRDATQPIIKRKKIVAGGGHHGGAWKVAYADFVTAMMAFFLLMWLLNATTERQRKGIADYFAPNAPISPVSAGGDSVLNGESVDAADEYIRNGQGGAQGEADVEDGESADRGGAPDTDAEAANLASLAEELLGRTGESDAADELLRHIVTRVTDEGLVIDIFARDGRPLFASGSAAPTPVMRRILAMVGDVVAHVSNGVTVTGHTDGAKFSTPGYDNWALSADRADMVRRVLGDSGVEPGRFRRIAGVADRELALPDAPEDPRNRRIALTLLRSGR